MVFIMHLRRLAASSGVVSAGLLLSSLPWLGLCNLLISPSKHNIGSDSDQLIKKKIFLSTVHNLKLRNDNRVTTEDRHIENADKSTADAIPPETPYAAHFLLGS